MNTQKGHPNIKHSPLARRLIIYMILFSASITLITSIIQLYSEYQRDIESMNAQFSQIENVHLRSFTQSLWATNYDELRIQLEGLVKLPNIIYAAVSNGQQNILETGQINTENIIQHQYEMQYEFLDKQYPIGQLTVVTTLDNIYAKLYRDAATFLISNGLRTLLVVIFIYFIFYHLVSRHISHISQHFQDLALDKNTTLKLDRSPSNNPDELDFLVSTANEMQQRINKAHKDFRESEKKYHTLAAVSPVGIFYTNTHGDCLYVNEMWCEISGLSITDAEGKGWINAIHPDDRERVFTEWEKSAKEGIPFKLEYRFKKSDNTQWVLGQAVAETDTDGKVIGYVGTITDITDRKKAEDAVRINMQRLADAQNMAHIGDWELDLINNQLSWSDEIYRMFEVDPNTFGASYEAFVNAVHPDDREKVNAAHADALTSKAANSIEHRLLMADGRIKYVIERCQTIFDDNGKPMRSTGTVQDITEQVSTEARATESITRLNKISSRLPGMVYQFELDTEGNMSFPYISGAVEEIYHLSKEEIQADVSKIFSVTHPDDIDKLNHSIQESAQTMQPWKLEYRICDKDGSIRWLFGNSIPEKTSNGNIMWSGFVTDITENKVMNESLRQNQKMDALGKLTGGIAHDYNNMLGVVLGYSELLTSMLTDDSKLKDYAMQITRAGERGAKLTKKLLNFSRNKSTDIEKANLNTLLQEEQLMLEKTLTARIKLNLKAAENLWPICVDIGDLEDAILNISINAMHAIESNGQLTIKTSNRTINKEKAERLDIIQGDYIQLTIHDTGHGMNSATKEKIFDPFYSTKGLKGTGLGLSQVYSFIKRCNGAVTVDSVLKEGTCFTLYFPRYQGIDTQKNNRKIKSNNELMGKESILVVDDEPALLQLSCNILSNQGYQVFQADSAKQALEIMATECIDLLFSDVIMPNMDGYTLAAIVQKKYPAIKIQLASGFSGETHIEKTDNILSINLLQKPYKAQQLLEKIKALLQ